MKARAAFTLVEILVVVAILCVLAVLIYPLLVPAKKRANSVSNMSAMRQFGQAAEMYNQNHGGWPNGTPPLVEVGLVPKELCAGNGDPYEMGIANRVIDASMGLDFLKTEYKNTYVGPREWYIDLAELRKAQEGVPLSGWLIDLSLSEPFGQSDELPIGWKEGSLYTRLLFDGSTQSVAHREVHRGERISHWHPFMLFGDFSDEWVLKNL